MAGRQQKRHKRPPLPWAAAAGRRLSKRHSHSRHKPGTPPGTIRHDLDAPEPVVQVIAYGASDCVTVNIKTPDEVRAYLGQWPVVWVNVDGLGDPEMIAGLGAIFGLHHLALEDVVNTHQRPKLEEYEEVLYLVARMLHVEECVETEQISLFLGKGFVLTFQERPGDCLEPVRRRIQAKNGLVRDESGDYLAYAILDAVIDDFFPHLDTISEGIEELELEVISRPSRDTASRIHDFQRDLLAIRRAIGPLRDAASHLLRSTSPIITDKTRIYLRDCYDHTFQIIDIVDTQREIGGGLLDIYLSSMSTRMNEIMKVLTIIATLFIPLTFIAGVYGMNFDYEKSHWNMPELHAHYGYPLLLGAMGFVVVLELLLFWRLGWFDQGPKGRR